jgi:hypothetical protein
MPEADSVAPAEVARNRKISTSRDPAPTLSNAIFFIHIPSQPSAGSHPFILLSSLLSLSSFAAGGGSALAFPFPLLFLLSSRRDLVLFVYLAFIFGVFTPKIACQAPKTHNPLPINHFHLAC